MCLYIIEIDPYAVPITYKLYTPLKTAPMCFNPFAKEDEEMEEADLFEGGVRDDETYSAYVIQINSARGTDIAFACQYNDCIIFDCITFDSQPPVQCPRLQNYFDNKMYFDELPICKDGTMVRVRMIMNRGSLYWLMYYR